jgi:hypothetical protein
MFSLRYATGMYPSPVATVLPQLHIEKPLEVGGVKPQCGITEGHVEPACAVEEQTEPEPSSPAALSNEENM